MTIKEKNLKLIMELIFIFLLPLLVIGINCKLENEYVYDNNGNFVTSEKALIYSGIDYITSISNNGLVTAYYDLVDSDYSDSDYVYYSLYIELNNNNHDVYNTANWSVLILCYDSNLYLIDTITLGSGSHYFIGNTNVVFIKFARNTIWTYYPIGNFINKLLYYYDDTIVVNSPFVNFKYMVAGAFNVDNTDTSFNIIFDYTCLWFLQFVIWHLLYGLFDFLMHLLTLKKKE